MTTSWLPQDSEDWLAFLIKTDYKIIRKIKESLPKITGKTFEEAALEGRGKQEAENIIEKLEELAIIKRDPPRENQNVDITKGLP